MNFQFSLILEYCPHGNIKNYLITHRNQFWASVVAYGSTRSSNLDNDISINLHKDCLGIIIILHIYRLIKASSLNKKLGY